MSTERIMALKSEYAEVRGLRARRTKRRLKRQMAKAQRRAQ